MVDPWQGVEHTVVLCNFGGPTAAAEVEPFLVRLFEDPFIIRTALLRPALRSWLARYIARKRAPRVAGEYAKIGFSPINRMTEIQAEHLAARLRERRPGTRVLIVNRYTAPDAGDVVRGLDLDALRAGRHRLFVATLYPHLCHSTTVSSLRDFDLALERVHGRRDVPSTRLFSWWQTPRYLEHTGQRLIETLGPLLARSGSAPVSIVFSAHGIPQRYNLRGDPYVTEIQGHYADMVRRGEAWLASPDGAPYRGRCHWHLSFQSRVGPVEWVKPYTDETVERLGKERGGVLLMVPISFTSDHIETLYEMDHTYRELALASGFSDYARVRPANEDPALAASLADALLALGF
jgi:ferrochelatase